MPEIERQQKRGKEAVVRADAAFAKREIYEALESRGATYAICTPANENLELAIAELVPRPVGRPSIRPSVEHKAFSTRRRVGRRPGGWWPRWSIIGANCSRKWVSSSRT